MSTRSTLLAGFAASSLLLLPTSGAVAQSTCKSFSEELVQLSNAIAVGTVLAESANCTTDVKFTVQNNGRGPQHLEHIVTDASGLPTEYSIKGKSMFGGDVDEHFERKGNHAVWRSQADHGNIADAANRLYIVNDGSPYTLAVYARALLAAKDGTLPGLPDGRLSITRLGEQVIGEPGSSIKIFYYRIDGRDTAPDYLALDADGRLFATTDGDISIRKGWEAEADAVSAAFERYDFAHADELQKMLAHRIKRLRVRNVRIFDAGSGTLSPNSDVIVVGNRITEIVAAQNGGQARRGEVIVDGAGGVLVPGLHDMHAHNSIGSALPYLAAGVTTVRDQGNDNEKLLRIVAGIRSGELPGPDIVYNGYLEGRSPYSSQAGFVVDDLPAALDAVRWYKQHGYWQMKLYSSIHPEWVKPIATLAHSLGMGVTGHIPAFTTPDQLIDDGYDELVHANLLLLSWVLEPDEDTRTAFRVTALKRVADLDMSSEKVRATIAHMQQKHIAFDATVAIMEQLLMSRAGATPPTFVDVIDHLPVSLRRDTRRSYISIASPEDDDRYKRAFGKVVDLVRMIHENGITLLPGTDHGDGFGLHRELEIYVMAGIKPAEALSIATLDMARYLGRQKDYGSIEVGKVADMFLIQKDPTQNISAIRTASVVFKGGFMYFPDEIYPVLNIKPFTTKPKVTQN